MNFFCLWLPEEADKVADRIYEHTNSLDFVHSTRECSRLELSLRTAVESDTLASSSHAKEPVVNAVVFQIEKSFYMKSYLISSGVAFIKLVTPTLHQLSRNLGDKSF